MDKSALKEYLKILIDMEQNILVQKNVISEIQNNIAKMKQTNEYIKPTEPKDASNFRNIFVPLTAAALGIIIGIWGYETLTGDEGNITLEILGFFGGLILMFIAFMFILFGILCSFMSFQEEKQTRTSYEHALDTYKTKLAIYNKNIEEERIRTFENSTKLIAYEHELELMMAKKQKSDELLLRLYDADIVYPTYRKLPLLCTIYEYLASGRADTLEGTDGAYNMLELEIRLDKIITKLDDIIKNLNAIQNNQYILYNTFVEANNKTTALIARTQELAEKYCSLCESNNEKLTASLEALTKTSAVNAYYNEQTAKELHYMNKMNYLTGKNDGVFFNQPPTYYAAIDG